MSAAANGERIAQLEAKIAELSGRVSALEGTKDWRSTFGMFTGNETMKRIDAAGRRIREQDRQKARRRRAPRRAAE
jgi:hypothetical protein